MGWSARCGGTITLTSGLLDAVWAAFCESKAGVDVDAGEYSNPEDGLAGKVGAVIASAIGNEFHGEGYMVHGDSEVVELSVWGDGKIRSVEEVLTIVAAHGAIGCIEACGEDDSRWRWRLDSGEVHDEGGRTVYAGDVDTEGWIAQLQAPDDHALNRIAVLPTEAAARAQIAAWCRDDYRAHRRDEVPASFPWIEDDADDEAVMAQWTGPLWGFAHRVVRVGAE